MAQIPGESNAQQHENMNDYSTIPNGTYMGSIVKSDVVLTKKAKEVKDPSLGQRISLQLKVLDGKYKGKILFASMNIIHPDPTTREIAEKELATISRACGKPGRVMSTEELHGIPMKLTVGTETSANYPDKNIISMYEPATGMASEGGTSGATEVYNEPETNQEAAEAPQKKKAPWD